MTTEVITMDPRLVNIITVLDELKNDSTVPKNVKIKLTFIIETLSNSSEDFLMRKDKALSELDEIADDTNIQAYTRTQIWNIVSALEML